MSKCVVVTGNPFDGLTIYGDPPFEDESEAVEWLGSNPVTDLKDDWNVVRLERTREEGEEEEELEQYRGHCPDHACPGVIEENGLCSHCGRVYRPKKGDVDDEGRIVEGPCPDQGCPGVLGSDGFCSHCGTDYQEKDDESDTD